MINLYEECLVIARITGHENGYAIGLHGSGQRDLDLIAVPWTDTATEPLDFLNHLASRIKGELKRGELVKGVWGQTAWPAPQQKPHGRMTYTILLGGPYYVDISVMPRMTGREVE